MPIRVDVGPLVASCKAAADELEALDAVERAAAQTILAAARPPIQTGRLAASGHVTTDNRVVWATPYAARVEARRHYASNAARDALGKVEAIAAEHAAAAAARF
jgi:hypothetical protein